MTPLGKSEDGERALAAPVFIPSLSQPEGGPSRNGHLPVAATLLVLEKYRDMVFPSALVEEISLLSSSPARWIDPERMDAGRGILAESEVLFSTWGTPVMDDAFLDSAPRLRAVFYAAGSPKGFLTPAVFERGISVSTAAAANAIPVAEFTIAAITFSLKQVLQTMRETRVRRSWIKSEAQTAGGYQSRVGLVSLGAIGRRVARSLQAMDVEILAYDPHVSEAQALALGVKLSSLEQIFDTCDAVSLHTPLLPSTEGMIDGSLIARLKPNATLINTSRGQIIRQAELCRVLQDRPDLTAILDVSETEPPEAESLLWTLPNIFLTPHISGSVGPECARMGRFMVDEFRRMLLGAPLQFQISPQTLELIA